MDRLTEGDTARDSVRSRRKRMRDSARGLHPSTSRSADVFQTPEWLDRSFVLPLTEPEVTDVPSQPVPHHDDVEKELPVSPTPESAAEPAPVFVRPPSTEIDFARVIRRSDLSRAATRTAMISTGVAGLILILFLLTDASIVLGMAIALGAVTLVAIGVRVRLATAPIPHLER
jgi:hypothetical protein